MLPLQNAPRSAVLATLALLLLLAPSLPAQTAGTTLIQDEIVVSASLTERPKQQVGSSVTVIDREEIEERNKTTVLELLRTVPGLEVAQTGGPGKVTSVFIRGGNSSHTLVLVDGVRVNSNTSGAFDFSDLTTDNLERIEVLRGPQGVLYGSEAVAGVVSIVTRRGQGPAKAWVRGALGSDEYSQLSAGVSGGNSRIDYSLEIANLSTDGVSAASEEAGNTEPDPWQNLTASGRLGGAFLDDGRIDLAVRYTDSESDVDGFTFGVGPTDDLNALQNRESLTTSISASKPITERWTQIVAIEVGQDELVGEDPDNFFSNFTISSDNIAIRTQANLTLSEQNTLSIGYKTEDREAENIGSFDESVTLRSFFAENYWSWQDRADISIGVRNDDHSVFGNETTYRLATSWRLGEATRFRGSFGTGFKAPTFNDLYFPGFGNPNLAPETSEGFDLGLEFTLREGRLVLDATYFDTEFDDLILFTFPAGFVNVAQATSQGFELSLDWKPSDDLQIVASHTTTDTEDLSTGLPLARRPEHRSTLFVSFKPTPKLRGAATLIVGRDRIDSDGSQMDDYERVDLSLDYRLNDRLRPFLRVENLLDEDYAEIPGYTTPGATVALGLHLEF